MKKIGVDVGFGYAKVVWFEGESARQLVIPSVLGRAAQVQQMDLSGLGGRKRHRTFNVTYQDEEYLVGSDALLHSATGVQATQTFGRIGSDEERILLLALLARAGLEDVCIVTGLPVLAWDLRHKLRRSWTGQHQIVLGRQEKGITVREVRTAWQPVLSLYDYALAFDGHQVALTNGMTADRLRRGWLVVDIGHNTCDRAAVVDLTPVDRFTGGARVGGRDILAVLNKRLEGEYGISRPIAELEEALRRGWLDVFSDRVDLLPLAQSAASSLSAQVASDVSDSIGDGSMFYGILVTGGPADVVRPAIARACPRNTVTALRDSQIANARGAATWGQGPGVFQTGE